jgi:L-ascorbate metabolism protein UlaG (beta-lactamase superfamily)
VKIRYIANACFHITLSNGQTLLTDPWFDGPCQQTWWNFPPVPEALKAEIWASQPDAIYISHLHHDHLHPQTLAPFDRKTPVIIGKMNTPNLRAALNVLGFTNLIEVPFETRVPWGAAELVLFKDFHGNTKGDETAIEYDLDTSIYLYDPDGTRLFNAVDNTILPADAARIAGEYGVPDIAMLPYASASLYPMAMGDYDDAKKLEAMRAIRARTRANFRENFRALGPKRVIPAGGEYVLGGPVAHLSRYLPQLLEAELAAEVGEALAKLHPGDALDSETLAITREKDAPFRDFTDDQRAAYAMTLADKVPSFAEVEIPPDLPFDWPRALKKCAANYAARRVRMGLDIAADIHLDVRDDAGKPLTGFSFSAGDGEGDRASLTYQLDHRLLFALITGLLSWNAIEASALITIRRDPDVYLHDLHRGIVHFTLVS